MGDPPRYYIYVNKYLSAVIESTSSCSHFAEELPLLDMEERSSSMSRQILRKYCSSLKNIITKMTRKTKLQMLKEEFWKRYFSVCDIISYLVFLYFLIIAIL